MRNAIRITVGLLLCLVFTLPVLADDLKVSIGVESGTKETKVVGANIYADIDGTRTQILVRPDDQAFFMMLKAGALNIGSFWQTNAKTEKLAQ